MGVQPTALLGWKLKNIFLLGVGEQGLSINGKHAVGLAILGRPSADVLSVQISLRENHSFLCFAQMQSEPIVRPSLPNRAAQVIRMWRGKSSTKR